MYRYGTPYGKPKTTTNQYVDHGDYVSIICKHGEEILVDKDDFDKVKDHSWCISKTGYAVTRIDGKVKKLHRYILDLTDPNKVVDHKNHNPFDNRRENMRVCTTQENSFNQKGNKNRDLPVGIQLLKTGKYLAKIYVNGKSIDLGRYEFLEDAINARIQAELFYRGEFAYHLNPDENDSMYNGVKAIISSEKNQAVKPFWFVE